MSVDRLQRRLAASLQRQPSSRPRSRAILGRPAALAVLLATMLIACALAGALAPPAGADIGETIILRCTHHESIAGFSQSDYRKALNEMEADTEEYSDCSQLIRQAQLAAAAGVQGAAAGLGTGAAPVPIPATPAEQQAIAHAERAAPEPVTVGGKMIHPGVVHVNIASALSTLPDPLLAILAFLLACALLVCARALRNRARGRAR